MSGIFINIWLWFKRHRAVYWFVLISSVLVMGFLASRVEFEENLTAFFPDTPEAEGSLRVYRNLKTADRVVLLLESKGEDLDSLYCAAEDLESIMTGPEAEGLVENFVGSIGDSEIAGLRNYVMANLPELLDEEAFEEMKSRTSPEAVDSLFADARSRLISPAGFALKDFILGDPLGLSSSIIAKSRDLEIESGYLVEDGRIFTQDQSAMLCMMDPCTSTTMSAGDDAMVTFIESSLASLSEKWQSVEFSYFGGPAVSIWNSRRIKADTLWTAILALLIIAVFICLVFKKKSSIFLILFPVAYGGLFALACISFISGSISGIAIGASSAVIGIAISYSIHILSHQNHVHSVEQLLAEIAAPMTVGGFTTIGAFAGLLFTSSGLLRDFGLFASLMLVGTTASCLIFLPYFLSAEGDVREGFVLRSIERFSSFPFEKCGWLKWTLALTFGVCLFFSGDVKFNSNMMDLNYWEPSLKAAEEKLTGSSGKGMRNVMVAALGDTDTEAFDVAEDVVALCGDLLEEGLIVSCANALCFLPPASERAERLARWNAWWTPERVADFRENVARASEKAGFKKGYFDDYLTFTPDDTTLPTALESFISPDGDSKMYVTQIRLADEDREAVYGRLSSIKGAEVFDPGWMTNKAASSVNDDFNWILWFSSLLIFIALWISYRRIELALLSFLPMWVSWIVITGAMAIFGIRFNIVSMILTTFIFGMGDDFSIFILDGLLSKYRTGRNLLDCHKTAIFFSTFTIIVGIGVLVFAKHPALHSLAVISILGMTAVVIVGYVVEPLLFNVLIAERADKGEPPCTLGTFVRLAMFYGFFFVCCLIVAVIGLLLLPFGRNCRERVLCWMACIMCRCQKSLMWFVHLECEDIDLRLLDEPKIIVANHLSSMDIVALMRLGPRIKMLASREVFANPFTGPLMRLMGYYSKGDDYETLERKMSEDLRRGWSVLIFPEGTRSVDGNVKRFHKGAFELAEKCGVDILPVVMYGNNLILPKKAPLAIGKGWVAMKFLPLVHPSGRPVKEIAKDVKHAVSQAHTEMCDKYDSVNPWFEWRNRVENRYRDDNAGMDWKGIGKAAKLIGKCALWLAGVVIALAGLSALVLWGMYKSADMSEPEYEQVEGEAFVSDSLRTFNDSWIRHSASGLWEMKLVGTPEQRGTAVAKMAPDLIRYQEDVFVDQIRTYVPSETYLAFLHKIVMAMNRKLGSYVPEEIRKEIAATSAGAGHNYDAFGTPYGRHLNYHAAHDIGHAMQAYMLVGCTSFAAWGDMSEDSSLIAGRNFDFWFGDGFAENRVVVMMDPSDGYRFIAIGWTGMSGVLSGMNEKGLTVTINASSLEMPRAGGTPVSVLAREILQYASNIEEAYAIAGRCKTFVCESFLICSASDGSAAVIEKTPKEMSLYVPDGESIICTNHYQSELFKTRRKNLENISSTDTGVRYLRALELMSSLAPLDAFDVQAILRDRKLPGRRALTLGSEMAIDQLRCHHSVIFQPAKLRMWVSAGPWTLGEYVCYDFDAAFGASPADEICTKDAALPADPHKDAVFTKVERHRAD